ncbi:MAG: hypothetical protein AB1782_14825 [Cyanobacteriota bacterium]
MRKMDPHDFNNDESENFKYHCARCGHLYGDINNPAEEVYLSQDFSWQTKKTSHSVLTRFLDYLEEKNIKIEKLQLEVVLQYAKK